MKPRPTTPGPLRSHPWLTSACRTPAGEIRLAGTVQNVPGLNPDAMRVLGSFALVYLVAGDGYYCDAGGRAARLVPGDVVMVFPDVAHAYGPREDQAWTQIYVVFDGPQFALWRRAGLLNPEKPVLHAEPVEYWRRRFEEAFTPRPMRGPAAALRTMGRFLHLVTDLLATAAEAGRKPDEVWLEESQHLLAEPVADQWLTPQQVARRVGLSYENFRKQFSQRAGVAPGQFQKVRRIERACAAIYQGTHGFKELADELGFCDVFHFSKVFKQVVGDTPSEFRKRVRGQ
jgi:AraC-like DNA-binding protein